MRIGQKLIHLESVDSTNNYTANLIKSQGLSSGTVILADEQFEGRGQRGTEWLVEPGMNLTFSTYLEVANLSVENQFDLSKVVALSICDFLEKVGIVANVKWPNDIYVNGNKIAGVLIENMVSGSGRLRSVVGIGINVNQRRFGKFTATSIQNELGTFHPIQDTLFSFLESFKSVFDELMDQPALLHERYLEKLYQFNVKKLYEDQLGVFEGMIVAVEQSGRLIVLKNNEKVSYHLKEIPFLR